MMNKINFFFAPALLFLILGCSEVQAVNSSEEDVRIELPCCTMDSDGNYFPVEFWNMAYSDGINCGKMQMIPSGSTIKTQVCKNRVASFFAEPVFPCAPNRENKGIPRPTGAIFPLNTELSFQNGFAASVLYSLYMGSSCGNATDVQEFLTRFNWQKFEQTCLEKSADPWLLDKERIMKAISSGKFKKSDIRLR
ncbi:MAG TPA: hypothetical protein DCZ76_09025 [Treponema sp.]|nr:hypothetical protein [Treponema sp.]